MPDSAVHMTTQHRDADGLAIRYADSGGVADETVLLLNPWPESLFAWNTIWSRLAENARLLAIDLPGFGQSERRAELLSPRAMGGFLLRLIDEWELGNPHVVGPDVGTGAVLFAAAEDVDRFPSAVVGSGGASFPLEVTGALKQIIEAPDLSGFEGIDGRDIVAGALEAIERHSLPEAVREDYLTSYAGERFVESAAYVRRYPSDLPVLAERLGDIRTPVQIIAGRRDALVPPSNAEFLHARLADSKLDILDTNHFAWEDGADDYLRLTRSWIEAHPSSRNVELGQP
jgi:pimeloyl-ACP methyl ester carboxylesterase